MSPIDTVALQTHVGKQKKCFFRLCAFAIQKGGKASNFVVRFISTSFFWQISQTVQQVRRRLASCKTVSEGATSPGLPEDIVQSCPSIQVSTFF